MRSLFYKNKIFRRYSSLPIYTVCYQLSVTVYCAHKIAGEGEGGRLELSQSNPVCISK